MKIALPTIERRIVGSITVERWGADGTYSRRPVYARKVGSTVVFDRDLRIKARVNAVVRTALLVAIGVVILPAVLVVTTALDLARNVFRVVRDTLADVADSAAEVGRHWLAAVANTAKEII